MYWIFGNKLSMSNHSIFLKAAFYKQVSEFNRLSKFLCVRQNHWSLMLSTVIFCKKKYYGNCFLTVTVLLRRGTRWSSQWRSWRRTLRASSQLRWSRTSWRWSAWRPTTRTPSCTVRWRHSTGELMCCIQGADDKLGQTHRHHLK